MLTVHFDRKTGGTFGDRLGFFNSGLVPVERYERDFFLIDRLKPHSLRIDLFMGDRRQPFGDLVDGTPDSIRYHFEKFDRFIRILNEHGTAPYISWCYNPIPLQPEGSDFRSYPVNEELYYDVIRTLSSHLKSLMDGRKYYEEIYNEPDCFDVFFSGSYEQYLRLYEIGKRAVRDAGSEAPVGGPAEAFVLDTQAVRGNLKSFLELAGKKDLRPGFLSFHTYGQDRNEYRTRTDLVESLVRESGLEGELPLHINEINVVPGPWPFHETILEKPDMLPRIFSMLEWLYTESSVSVVHWAQFLSSGVDALGIVDEKGCILPAFYAFEIHARMQGELVPSEGDESIGCLAVTGEDKASAVFWNRKEETLRFRIRPEGLAADRKTVKIYRIGQAFLERLEQEPHLALDAALTGSFPAEEIPEMELGPNDIVYIECGGDGI